jgi:hypothetical protein
MSDGDNQGWGAPAEPGQSGQSGWPNPTPPNLNPPYQGPPTGPTGPGGSGEPGTQFYPTHPGATGGYPGQPTPPYQPSYGPPGSSGPGAPLPGATVPPPPGGMTGRTLAIIIVVLVLIAGGVIGGVLASRGGKHHVAKSTPPVAPTTSAASSPTSFNSESASASNSASATNSNDSTNVPSLMSITPFSGCQQVTVDKYPDVTASDEIGCEGSDLASFSAQEVIFERFASASDLATWYANDVLARNSINQNIGDCTTEQVVSTTKQAQYCEGSFEDDTGSTARQVLILAPIAVDVQIGQGSLSTICSGQSSYTILVFTSPSDDVGGGILSCSGTAATAKAFENALQNGDLDLND